MPVTTRKRAKLIATPEPADDEPAATSQPQAREDDDLSDSVSELSSIEPEIESDIESEIEPEIESDFETETLTSKKRKRTTTAKGKDTKAAKLEAFENPPPSPLPAPDLSENDDDLSDAQPAQVNDDDGLFSQTRYHNAKAFLDTNKKEGPGQL